MWVYWFSALCQYIPRCPTNAAKYPTLRLHRRGEAILFRLEQRVEVCFLFDLIEPRSSLQTARLSRMCLNTPEAEQGPWIQVIGSLKLEHCTSVPIACSILDSMTGAKNMNSRPWDEVIFSGIMYNNHIHRIFLIELIIFRSWHTWLIMMKINNILLTSSSSSFISYCLYASRWLCASSGKAKCIQNTIIGKRRLRIYHPRNSIGYIQSSSSSSISSLSKKWNEDYKYHNFC